MNDVVLSADPDTAGTLLKSLLGYDAELASSRSMDRVLWPSGSSADISALSARLSHRAAWLDAQLDAWSAGGVTEWFFADVPAGKWFFEPVREAVALGLFQGTSSVLFRPEARMTPRSMAAPALPTPRRRRGEGRMFIFACFL